MTNYPTASSSTTRRAAASSLVLALAISSSCTAFTSLQQPSFFGHPRSRTNTAAGRPSIQNTNTKLSLLSNPEDGNSHSSSSKHSQHNQYPNDQGHRMTEFMNLEPLDETEERKRRLEEDDKVRSQFVAFGDDLWDLRSKMDKLASQLINAITNNDVDIDDDDEDDEDYENEFMPLGTEGGFVDSSTGRFVEESSWKSKEQQTRERLRAVEQQDPELVYAMELAAAEAAERQGEDASQHRAKAAAARKCLPQFNLEGLWVGKYGANGYEMINVTYIEDTLIAEKVTGDKNVPRGELTFQVDLNPLRFNKNQQNHRDRGGYGGSDDNGGGNTIMPQHPSSLASLLTGALQPIVLTDRAARKWGTRQLPRYSGMGQVAEEGFINNQWMDGQLIIIGDEYFSFAWIPIEQQIFFGRPSPELALKMLRDHGVAPLRGVSKTFTVPPSLDDDIEIQKEFVERCLEITDEVQEEQFHGSDSAEFISGGCVLQDPETGECFFE